jgi:hypothetical protein
MSNCWHPMLGFASHRCCDGSDGEVRARKLARSTKMRSVLFLQVLEILDIFSRSGNVSEMSNGPVQFEFRFFARQHPLSICP